MRRLTKTARYIAEIANLVLPNSLPYVGKSAFAHKGGMHVDGVTKNPHSFEHIDLNRSFGHECSEDEKYDTIASIAHTHGKEQQEERCKKRRRIELTISGPTIHARQ